MIPAPITTTSLERGIGLSFDVPTNPTPRVIGGLVFKTSGHTGSSTDARKAAAESGRRRLVPAIAGMNEPGAQMEADNMDEVIHLSKIRVIQEKRPNRRAYIADFPQPVYFGVHAGVAAFYKMTPDEPLPSTLDYLVAAAAG